MRIPDEINRTVVFIGVRNGDGSEEYAGTGFVVGIPSRAKPGMSYEYFVTARHVAEPLHGLDIFLQTMNKAGEVHKFEGQDLPWVFHPDQDVDVAVLPISGFGTHIKYYLVHSDIVLTAKREEELGIGIGDEVVVPGLFTRLKETVDPIIRIGNLAMRPKGKVISAEIRPGKFVPMEGLLIDQRSLGGMSGCPVFVRETVSVGGIEWADGVDRPLTGLGGLFLLGLMHGHWKVDPSEASKPLPKRGDYPIGMSIVVPAEKILEAISQESLRLDLERSEERVRSEMEQEIGSATTGDMGSTPT
jgi:hypothetical protein